ncbi:hypothetical protein B0H14DRAFT_2561747 [Mycena olivaceomarginata]|nr:hypothetical protein B0H14DRAFT_2561747 [Mycena olivaceomarginata]
MTVSSSLKKSPKSFMDCGPPFNIRSEGSLIAGSFGQCWKFQQIESGIMNLNSINEMRRQSEIMQTEIMELISTFSEHTISDSSSSIYQRADESHVRLPSRPKIFHGRESELQEIVNKSYARPTPYLTKQVIQYFSECSSVLLVWTIWRLAWEPMSSRGEVEGFLSLLTDIGHLALVMILTTSVMSPQLLSLTNNIPLAVDLMAHLVDYEGCSSGSNPLGDRENISPLKWTWKKLQFGCLHQCFTLEPSYGSLTCQIPAKDILTCKAVLLSTSLVYTNNAQLKVLVPVREYMQQHYPAAQSFIQSITSNLANMQSILTLELYPSNPRLEDIVHSITRLNDFEYSWGIVQAHASTILQRTIPSLATQGWSQAEKNFDSFDDPVVKWAAGNHLAAQSNAQRAQKLARLQGDMYYESLGLSTEALVCLDIGAYRNTIALCTQARELLCQCGLKGSETDSQILSYMGETYYLKSEYREAQEICMQIKNATSDQQNSIQHALAVLNLAEITIITGENLDHIAQVLTDQKKIFATVHDSVGMATTQTLFLHHTQSEINEIARVSLEQLASLKNWGVTAIGWVFRWAHVFLLAHAFKCQNKLAVHKALSSIGHLLLAMGDLNTAQSLFIVALEGFTWMDVHRSRAECMLHLGEISEQRGDLEEAISCFKAVHPLFECSSQAKDVEHMDSLVRGLEEEIERGHNTKLAYLSALNAPPQDIFWPPVEMEDGLANPIVV